MTRREVVMEFLRCFSSGDIDALEPLLAEDLQFSGPFHHFGSRYAYIQSLREDPPEKCGYRLISLAESGDDVCVFYDYEKSDKPITVAQLCKFNGRKISEILLVFDGGGAT
jgi:hypothetical protein